MIFKLKFLYNLTSFCSRHELVYIPFCLPFVFSIVLEERWCVFVLLFLLYFLCESGKKDSIPYNGFVTQMEARGTSVCERNYMVA